MTEMEVIKELISNMNMQIYCQTKIIGELLKAIEGLNNSINKLIFQSGVKH